MEKTDKYPEGYFVNKWMAIGVAAFSVAGFPIAISTGNPGLIGIGPAIGVSVGLSIGMGLEAKYRKEGKIRKPTKKEKERRQRSATIGLVVLTITVLLGLTLFISRL